MARPWQEGILNPLTEEIFLGSLDSGITHNGIPAQASERRTLEGATSSPAASESARGEWERFLASPFRVVAVGSMAHKLARVAAGLADATFTLPPKYEWDVAGGAALVQSVGGFIRPLEEREDLAFNRPLPRITGLIACGTGLPDALLGFLGMGKLPGGAHG